MTGNRPCCQNLHGAALITKGSIRYFAAVRKNGLVICSQTSPEIHHRTVFHIDLETVCYWAIITERAVRPVTLGRIQGHPVSRINELMPWEYQAVIEAQKLRWKQSKAHYWRRVGA
ncbi:MAG: hypothetical protein HRU33_05500 [Rhodobacteraceae bacterium]|nr:hypothetical protein [Paracoccaceae bacterium]